MSVLPAGWELAVLRDIATDISYGFTTNSALNGEGPKLLRITDIQNGNVDWRTVPHCVDAPRNSFMLQASDIVIARTGATTGKSFLIETLPCATAFASYLIRARLAEEIEPRYVWSFMQSQDYWSQIQVVSKGTAQPGANAQLLSQLQLPVAPLAEQRRIVTKINSLSAKFKRARDQLDHVPRLVEKYKQTILAAAFHGALTKSGRAHRSESFPSGLWPIPSEWKWLTVAGVGEVSLGRQRSPKDHYGPQMRRYVRAANITWRGWNLTDVKEMNFDDAEFARFKLRPGDVLLNEGSGSAKEVGKPAIWQGEIQDCCFQNTLLRVRPTACSSEFLYRYFLFCALTELFVSSTQGVNIYHIGKDGLARFPVPLPPRKEQGEIVGLIETAFAWIDRLAREASSARKLVDHLDEAILTKAFKGELVPQDPNDEPADVLLARIRADRQTVPMLRHRRNGGREASGATATLKAAGT
jgi:type I restriction enzyme S subunit